jgi:transposase
MHCIDQTIAHRTTTRADDAAVLVSLELSTSTWLVTVLLPGVDKLSQHKVTAGNWSKLHGLLGDFRNKAEQRLGRPAEVICIQEAGLDGFSIHRLLEGAGFRSLVVDAASIPVPRRRRRAKTDSIDGETLLRCLAAWLRGESKACSIVVPPSVEEEDRRRLVREREWLVAQRTAETNRIGGLLKAQGIAKFKALRRDARAQLAACRTADGRPLPPYVTAEIERALDRLEALKRQIAEIETVRNTLMQAELALGTGAVQLLRLVGIGPEGCAVLWFEAFYRSYANRRKLAAYAGLAASPWRSGKIDHEQGISKAGNPRLRRILIQLAWLWLKYQPDSALSRWYRDRVAGEPGKCRRIYIVALARKLLVALWRFVTDGVVPEGARLATA